MRSLQWAEDEGIIHVHDASLPLAPVLLPCPSFGVHPPLVFFKSDAASSNSERRQGRGENGSVSICRVYNPGLLHRSLASPTDILIPYSRKP